MLRLTRTGSSTVRPWRRPSRRRPSLTVSLISFLSTWVGAISAERSRASASRASQMLRRPVSQILAVHLDDVGAQTRQGPSGLAGDDVEHRGLEVRVPLALDVVHQRRRHSRLLQLAEGLARLDRTELPAVAHHRHADDAQMVGDLEQPPGLVRAGKRHLVHHENRAGQEIFRIRLALSIPRQEPLQGPRRDPGFAGQRPCRARRRGETDDPLGPGERRPLPSASSSCPVPA